LLKRHQECDDKCNNGYCYKNSNKGVKYITPPWSKIIAAQVKPVADCIVNAMETAKVEYIQIISGAVT